MCAFSLSQYVANVDESPAYMGGKENMWRKLNLDGKTQSSMLSPLIFQEHSSPSLPPLHPTHSHTLAHTVLPCHSFLHNIVVFLEHAHMPGGLSLERLQSFKRPPTQAEQIEHIKAVTSMR